MEDVVSGDRSVLRVDDLAERLAVSVRTLQRVADRYVGLSPLAIIRRYRLQEERLGCAPNPTPPSATWPPTSGMPIRRISPPISLGRLGCRPPRTGGISGISGGQFGSGCVRWRKVPDPSDPRDFVASASGIKTIGHDHSEPAHRRFGLRIKTIGHDHIRNPAPSSLRPQGSKMSGHDGECVDERLLVAEFEFDELVGEVEVAVVVGDDDDRLSAAAQVVEDPW